MDSVLKALADETRRRIVALVWDEDRTAGEIAAQFAMTRPGVSQHLKVLLEAGVVCVRAAGTRRFYRANPDRVREARLVLEAFWDDRLRHLKRLAEAAQWERDNDR
ncbi:MAG TPA: metalloregulator ArsR/SmtB family transcription factor [Stellaceae bacterium]|nr:metalloregulator ArsR/SmtB family transcription factor [Stellaceae bacterium]